MKRDHRDAVAAGLGPREIARWRAYLALKARKGETPITLTEAVAQVRAARPTPS